MTTPLSIATFLADDSGATAIEYGLIIGLVALVIVGAVSAMGGSLDAVFSNPDLDGALTAPAAGG